MDEVRFAQYGSRCRMWVPPEVRDPVLLHSPTRKSVGYWGAIRLRDGAFVYRRETDSFNGQTCLEFLRQLSARSRRSRGHPGGRTVVIADNAKFHYATLHQPWRDAQAPEFALDFLPPYSPELNPIERVWKLVRRLCLHNRYFAELPLVVQTPESYWRIAEHRHTFA